MRSSSFGRTFANRKNWQKIQCINKFTSANLNDNISKPQNTKSKLNAFYVLNWKAEEIAEQLTFISVVDLSVLQNRELLGGKFMKKDKHITSPTIIKISKRFDDLIMFVIQDILSYEHKRTRTNVIEKRINISHQCKEIHNFNDNMATIQGLLHFIIQQLTKTWKYVSE